MQTMYSNNISRTIFEQWVEAYTDKMYSWAFYKTNSKETAEDLVQDTFLAAFQAIDKFEGKSNPKTWLLGILNNKIAEHFRKSYQNPITSVGEENQYTGDSLLDALFDTDGHWIKEQQPGHWNEEQTNLLDDAGFLQVLQHCMGTLQPGWYAVIQLKYMEERKGAFICQELNIAPTNLWQILHRAKLQLRKCIEVNWFKK